MGISFSTTTTRRSTTALYPPPHPPMDYYSSSYPPPHSPVYNPYYNSNAYSLCNHSNPFLAQPYFGAIDWQAPPPPPPTRMVTPPCDNQEKAKVVNSEVNVHKDSFRLEVDDLKPGCFLISFVFDALADGSITIHYFAKEEIDRRVVSLYPETYVPIKIPFRKGLHQEFRQPSGTGIDFRFFALDDLSTSTARDDVFPVVISAETCPPSYIVDDRSYILPNALPQMQVSQVLVVKNQEGQFTPKVIRQLLWSDDICYELREIYGLGKSADGGNDNGSGKDCVICLTEPKDIAVLPCRHMCMCSNCAKELKLQSNKCPICREIIEALLEIKIDNIDQYPLSVIAR